MFLRAMGYSHSVTLLSFFPRPRVDSICVEDRDTGRLTKRTRYPPVHVSPSVVQPDAPHRAHVVPACCFPRGELKQAERSRLSWPLCPLRSEETKTKVRGSQQVSAAIGQRWV